MNEWDEHAASWDAGEAQRAYAEAAFASLEGILSERDRRLLVIAMWSVGR